MNTNTQERKIAAIRESLKITAFSLAAKKIELELGSGGCREDLQEWINLLEARGKNLQADLDRLEATR